jgi:hypothetical protein
VGDDHVSMRSEPEFVTNDVHPKPQPDEKPDDIGMAEFRSSRSTEGSSLSPRVERRVLTDRLNIRAYKFFESQYLDSLIELGRIRIGTANSFREQDGVEGGRSDQHEFVTAWSPDHDIVMTSNDHPFVKKVAGGSTGGTFVMSKGARFSLIEDALLLCFSTAITPAVCQGMYEKFGCDMYYEVPDLARYIFALMDADTRLENGAYKPVSYDRTGEFELEFREPYFRKRPEFAWQNEGRMIFGGSTAGGPFILDVPKIRNLIRVERNPAAPPAAER